MDSRATSNLELVRQHWSTVLPTLERGAKVLLGSGINSLGSGFDLAATGGAALTNLNHQFFVSPVQRSLLVAARAKAAET